MHSYWYRLVVNILPLNGRLMYNINKVAQYRKKTKKSKNKKASPKKLKKIKTKKIHDLTQNVYASPSPRVPQLNSWSR